MDPRTDLGDLSPKGDGNGLFIKPGVWPQAGDRDFRGHRIHNKVNPIGHAALIAGVVFGKSRHTSRPLSQCSSLIGPFSKAVGPGHEGTDACPLVNGNMNPDIGGRGARNGRAIGCNQAVYTGRV